jgi:hypothetical protein
MKTAAKSKIFGKFLIKKLRIQFYQKKDMQVGIFKGFPGEKETDKQIPIEFRAGLRRRERNLKRRMVLGQLAARRAGIPPDLSSQSKQD